MNWKAKIVKLVWIKQLLEDEGANHSWTYFFPRVAASIAQIRTAESALGFSLHGDYVEFLLHANGWKQFYRTVDLFGTDDLLRNEEMVTAIPILHDFEKLIIETFNIALDQILIIGVSQTERILFATGKPSNPLEGNIFWMQLGEIQKFDNFNSFYLEILDSHLDALTLLRQNRQTKTEAKG